MAVDEAGQSRPKVTITAIAQEAGVSVPTVSRVVNGRSDVAPETRAKVEDLLRRHGYQRRGTAGREGAGLIDLVFSDLDSPWAVEIIRGWRRWRTRPGWARSSPPPTAGPVPPGSGWRICGTAPPTASSW